MPVVLAAMHTANTPCIKNPVTITEDSGNIMCNAALLHFVVSLLLFVWRVGVDIQCTDILSS